MGVLAQRVVCVLCIASAKSETGHLSRVGRHAKPMDGPDVREKLSPEEFYDEYVRQMKPVVLKGAVTNDKAISLWTLDYLLQTYGGMKARVEPKDEADYRSDVPNEALLVEFFGRHKAHGYVVTQLPMQMANETTLPSCMSCGPTTDHIIEANLWVSTGDTNSRIHKDSNNQMNCLYRGTKEWTLFHPRESERLYLINEIEGQDQTYDTAGMSRIETREVDFTEFPKFKGANFMVAKLQPGDCIFVPGSYLHHVYSTGHENVQVSLLFAAPDMATARHLLFGERVYGKSFSESPHEPTCTGDLPRNRPLVEIDIAWTFDGNGSSPITMGFDSPSRMFHELRRALAIAHGESNHESNENENEGRPLRRREFVRVLLDMPATQCDGGEAFYEHAPEMHRHVLDALAVLFPHRPRRFWNQTCDSEARSCQIPGLCEILRRAAATEAFNLFDRVKREDGLLHPADFSAVPRRTLQEALLSPFVIDQITSVFESVTGDYEYDQHDKQEL